MLHRRDFMILAIAGTLAASVVTAGQMIPARRAAPARLQPEPSARSLTPASTGLYGAALIGGGYLQAQTLDQFWQPMRGTAPILPVEAWAMPAGTGELSLSDAALPGTASAGLQPSSLAYSTAMAPIDRSAMTLALTAPEIESRAAAGGIVPGDTVYSPLGGGGDDGGPAAVPLSGSVWMLLSGGGGLLWLGRGRR